MNKSIFMVLVVLGVWSLYGQVSSLVQTVNFPKGDAAWTVEISSATGTSRIVPVKVEALRSGDLLRQRVTWSDRTVSENWLTSRYLFLQDRVSGRFSLYENARLGSDSLLMPMDETLFAWIKPDLTSSSEVYRGRSCLSFRTEMGVPYQAWIEAKTGTPVAFHNGKTETLYVFSFLSLPKTTLSLPPKCMEMQAQHEKETAPPEVLGEVRQQPPPG